MEFIEFLTRAVKDGASDLFLIAGGPLSERIGKRICPLSRERLTASDCEQLVVGLYQYAGREMNVLKERGDDRFSFSAQGLARFRVSAYLQRGSMAAVIRIVAFGIPDGQSLGIPEQVLALADENSGLVLLAGASRSGKSTTQACLVDHINQSRDSHIITIENPIEYLHRDQKSLVSQREVGIDTGDYHTALEFALQQSPDVISISELSTREEIRTALSAAESGVLVIAALHTQGAVSSIERLVKAFPTEQRDAVREQIGQVLRAVVSQQLLPGVSGGMVPAFEILYPDNAARALIREGNAAQLEALVAAGNGKRMLSMDQSILRLYQQKRISKENVQKYSVDPEMMKRKMWIIGG